MPTVDSATWNVTGLDNATEPNSDRQSEPETFSIYIQFAAIVSLLVVTVSGNLLLLAIVLRSRQLRSTVSNALIVNLAVADCMVGVFVLPAFAATVLQGRPPVIAAAPGLCSSSKRTFTATKADICCPPTTIASTGLCSAFGVVAIVLSSESLLTLGAIAVDRFLNICHPLVYMRLAEPYKMVIFISKYICFPRLSHIA